jgi:hypothetical protein
MGINTGWGGSGGGASSFSGLSGSLANSQVPIGELSQSKVSGLLAVKKVQAVVDFGFASGGESGYTSVDVAATWVTANTRIWAQLDDDTTATHEPIDGILEQLLFSITDLNPGVGFTLHARAPQGTFGQYKILCIGAETV